MTDAPKIFEPVIITATTVSGTITRMPPMRLFNGRLQYLEEQLPHLVTSFEDGHSYMQLRPSRYVDVPQVFGIEAEAHD